MTCWDINAVCYGALTMRNIYEVLASQYDPLGFILPYTTRAKGVCGTSIGAGMISSYHQVCYSSGEPGKKSCSFSLKSFFLDPACLKMPLLADTPGGER